MSEPEDTETRRVNAVAATGQRGRVAGRVDFVAGLLLSLIAFALYIMPAALNRPLSATPEARVAVVAREMLQNHEYVVPTLGGDARVNKPPLVYWLTAGFAKLLHADPLNTSAMARATLLPSALATALCVLLVVLYGCAVFGRTAGILSGLLLGSAATVCHYGQLGYVDTTLMLMSAGVCCSAAWLFSAPRPSVVPAITLGVALGLGILTKGHIVPLFLLLPVVVEIIIRRSFDGRKTALFVLALALAAVIHLPWFMAVEHQHPGSYTNMRTELEDSVDSKGHAQHDGEIYYLYRLAGGLLPWTPLLIIGLVLAAKWKKQLAQAGRLEETSRQQLRFLLLYLGLGFAGLYLIQKKQEYYLLPLFPALALAGGQLLSRFKTPGGFAEEIFGWAHLITSAVVALAIATIPFWPAVYHGLSGTDSNFAREVALFFGWTAIPLALAFAAVQFYCARQWVEGRPLAVGLVLAAVMLAGWSVWSVQWTKSVRRNLAINKEAPGLRSDLDKLGSGVLLYNGGGISQPLLVYYLARPVEHVSDMARETSGKAGSSAPQRVLLGTRDGLAAMREDYQLDSNGAPLFASDRTILAWTLDRNVDWPKRIAAVVNEKGKERVNQISLLA